MSENSTQQSENTQENPRYETDEFAEKRFRGWRLISVIIAVVLVLALVAGLIDWAVIGPLEGRVF